MKATHTNSQNGQSLIIIALMIVGILGFLGLVLDGGQVFVTRRNSQDAADAAAFAAVRVLALRSDSSAATEQAIYNAALNYARVNQVITNTDVTVAFLGKSNNQIRTINPSNFVGVPPYPLATGDVATGVRVTATIRLQPYFIDLLIGNNPIPVSSVAAAQSGPPSVASLLTPMAIYCDPQNPCIYTYGLIVQLFGSVISNGGFQWIDYLQTNPLNGGKCGVADYLWLTCNSGPVLADKSDTYYNPLNPTQYNPPSLPYPNPWIAVDTGKQFAQIADALDCWLFPNGQYQGPGGGGWLNCWQQPGQGPKPTNTLWTVPVFDYDNGKGGGTGTFYHTIMFAEFDFQGYWFSNSRCNWQGKKPTDNCSNPPASSNLQPCAGYGNGKGIQCLMGSFVKQVKSFQIKPDVCNTMGLDACAYGLSQ